MIPSAPTFRKIVILLKDEEGKPISVFDADIFDYSNVGLKGDKSKNIFATSTGKDDFANALKTDVLDKLKESKAYEDTTPRGGSDAAQPDFGNEKLSVPEDPEQNKPSNTEISAEDLIRENAELFKELLGEGQKEKVKKARIGDASDYLLKFFEGTQQEGATVGSAAADVAGFATSRDSRTEKARAANEKVDQTATVLAINDYISGKRSKEDIQKALSIAAAIETINFIKRKKVIKNIWKKGNYLKKAVKELIKKYDLQKIIDIKGYAPWTSIQFTEKNRDENAYIKTLFISEMLKNGVLINSTNNISYALSDPQLKKIIKAYSQSFKTIKEYKISKKKNKLLYKNRVKPVFKIR